MIDLPIVEQWIQENALLFAVFIVWSIIWKGLALWKSAGLRQKWWFIAILLLNTFGILEIIYLFVISRKYKVEVVDHRNEAI